MARDFRAKQLRTSIIIGSGSIESTKPHLGLVFYSASKASDFEGVRRTGGSGASVHGFVNADGLGDDTTQTAYLNLTHESIGHDVWCVFDGASHGTDASLLYGVGNAAERLPGSTVLFLGDVVVSGSLFAERQIIEVDTTTTGDFRTPVGSSAFFDGGFAAGGSLYMVRYMMKGISNLQADGTMQHKNAIGAKGHVYSRIRPNEEGEIQIGVDGSLRTLLARARDKTKLIPSGELIVVVDVIGSTMIVEPLSEGDELSSEEN